MKLPDFDLVDKIRAVTDKFSFDGSDNLLSVSKTEVERAINNDEGFMGSTVVTGVSDGNSLNVVLENPSGSGLTLYIKKFNIQAGGEVSVNVYKNSTIDSAGSSVTTSTLSIGSGATTSMNTDTGGGYSTGTLVDEGRNAGGNRPQTRVGTSSDRPSAKVLPDNNIHIVVTNNSGGTTFLAVRFEWVEV